MIKVTHIITGLSLGGAETMLYRVVRHADVQHFKNEVISLTDLGGLASQIQGAGVSVRALGMKRSIPNPLLVMRLARWIRESRPDVIQTWMDHANLVGGLAAHLAGRVPVIWDIQHSVLEPEIERRRTIFVDRACALLSRRIPTQIVCCSEVSRCVQEKLGYVPEKLQVIPNGVDPEQFRPDPIAPVSVRNELGLPADIPLIGMAARFHAQKDHRNFAEAAALLHVQVPRVHFLLCGDGVTHDNPQLVKWIVDAGIQAHCHLLGPRQDMPRLFAAMDIATTSSISGEGFPLVIVEAMACGTPCVVTDVGDSALIVGEAGMVVAPGNPQMLAGAWREMIEASHDVRRHMGTIARRRVQQHFALSAIVQCYETMYAELAAGTTDCSSLGTCTSAGIDARRSSVVAATSNSRRS
jgi:glycosyltransferase involved in cell wall biosynthesis